MRLHVLLQQANVIACVAADVDALACVHGAGVQACIPLASI